MELELELEPPPPPPPTLMAADQSVTVKVQSEPSNASVPNCVATVTGQYRDRERQKSF